MTSGSQGSTKLQVISMEFTLFQYPWPELCWPKRQRMSPDLHWMIATVVKGEGLPTNGCSNLRVDAFSTPVSTFLGENRRKEQWAPALQWTT